MAARLKPSGPTPPPGQRFKSAIEEAKAGGATPAGLLLQLTRTDSAKIRRDRNIAIEDISYSEGEMRYLGVKVVEGDTAASALITVEP